MSAWMLSYLFYVGIVLPTVVTLALFVVFVICWRRQSARKAVLTKPYDPHGTMRRLGIPNRPPPPPVFARAYIPPSLLREGGEDNAAYDMSRSPSAEAQAGVNLAAPRSLPFRLNHHADILRDANHFEQQLRQAQKQQMLLQGSPCVGEMGDVSGRLAYHNRLDSGLSEPAYDSPVSGAGGTSAEGACGGGGGRERPQSQNSHASHASHSSHSTDSEDSGFRSSRSGQLAQTAEGCAHDPPVMKRSRSAGRSPDCGQDSRGAGGSCPDGEGDPPIQLTPTTLWTNHPPHLHNQHPHPHHHHQYSPHPVHQHPSPHTALEDTGVKTTGVDLQDIRAQLDWKYLQHLAYSGYPTSPKGKASPGAGAGPAHRPPVPCQRLTLAHVHSSCDRDNPEVLGFSVV
ncbi:hypothetical protein ACOMHN_003386 [Nucella lapillus]